MEKVIDDIDVKNKCQVFTPDKIVNKMLSCAQYNKELFGKKVLENSCGDGKILSKIVITYIESARKIQLSDEMIIRGLEQDIIAFEIDAELIKKCTATLTKIAARYGLKGIKWNITCDDFLKSNCNYKFDFIIGNPPYIAYPDLKKSIRKYVKENFKTCKKGKFDYCYAFIEKSYNLLSDSGVLVYIIPSNIFKNVFAYEIRSLIKNDLELIIEYPNEKVFQGVLVSPAIIKIQKGLTHNRLRHVLYNNGQEQEKEIMKSHLEKKWIFNTEDSLIGKRVGDYFLVSNSVATLLNDAFILEDCNFDNNFCYFGETKIEREIVKKAASPRSKKLNKNEHIIFPYYYDSNGLIKLYSEEQMTEHFPLALAYLRRNKTKLENRRSDKNTPWYGYGRSQALQNSNLEMILISSVISENTKAYLLSIDEIPYSGLYIIANGDFSLNKLLISLDSRAFKEYVKKVGICVNGKSMRITTADIKNFVFEVE